MKLLGGSGKNKHSVKKSDHDIKKSGNVFEENETELPDVVVSEIDSSKLDADETPPRKKRDKKRVALIVVAAVAVLIGGCTAAYFIWEKPPESKADAPRVQKEINTDVNPYTSPEVEPGELTGRKKNCYTFMIAVTDEVGANTDAIMVGRFDTDAGTLDIVSIPRDTLVNVSWSVKKINTIYAARGLDPELFVDSLADVIGFEVDCYAIIKIKMVSELVDCVGGITYNVKTNMHYDDPAQDLYIHVNAGEQLIDGAKAIQIMRYRSYPNGDLGRIEVQQDFLSTAAEQMISLNNITLLNNAIEIFTDNVVTDLTASNLAFFAREFLMLDQSNITFNTMPGWSDMVMGGSYYVAYVDEWLEMVNEYLNPFYEEITLENVDIGQYSYSSGFYSTASMLGG